MGIMEALERAKQIILAQVKAADDKRETAWLEEPWPLFEGATRLKVTHITLRRWRYLKGSGLLDKPEAQRHLPTILFYFTPAFKYLDSRAFRRWRWRVYWDLRQRDKCSEGFAAFMALQLPSRPSQAGEDPGEFSPWKVLNIPLDEVLFIDAFGAALGGKDAVLDCPLPQLWQMFDYAKLQNQLPGEPVALPGDSIRKKWDGFADKLAMGEDISEDDRINKISLRKIFKKMK